MTDELTRPLGLKTKPTRRWKPVFLGLALVAAGALAGWGTVAIFMQEKPQEVAVAVPPQDTAPKGDVTPPAAEAAQTQPEAARPVDPDAAPLEAAIPDGQITEKVPVPVPSRRQETGLAHLPDPELVERTDQGVVPKRSSAGLRPMDVYSRQPATEGNFGVARVVLIVGGVGISQTGSQQAVRQLPGAVTLAFAPYGNSLLRWMQEARKKGHEVMLQVPMEPFDYPANNPGPHTLRTGVAAGEVLADLHWSMSRITNYVGVINFLGGKFITDTAAMKPVFDELAGRGLLFIDDGSVRNSLTRETAAQSLLPYARAHVQIDVTRTRAEIMKQLELLASEAKRTGLAIGVANAFPESIELIARFAEEASSKGIEITPVSAIVSDPEGKRG